MTAVLTRGTVTMVTERCKGCELCIPACRPGVLRMSTESNHHGFHYPELLAGCTACRACYEICPDFVFDVYRYETPIELDDGRDPVTGRRGALMVAQLLQGADAITEAAIAAGCKFFAGYPMLPFTDLLERMSRRLPQVGGVCMNAASELEAVNMTLGAAAAGARAGTGSTGQGVALMQEAVAEAAQAEIPFVVFTMARGQQDYFQCTRGGGWGDYRTITLAPRDVVEAAEHTQLAFHLADLYRSPTILYGDYLIADTNMSVEVVARSYGPLPAKDWAVDGSRGGTGRSRVIWSWDMGKVNNRGLQPDGQWRKVAAKFEDMAATEARHETYLTDDAEFIVASWGTSAAFVDYVVDELRADGVRIGSFRPITLWPFPEKALEEAAANARRVLVYEVNAGQMLEDVRLSISDRSKIRFIGGVSVDYSGMRQGNLLDVAPLRDRIRQAIEQGD